MANIAQTVNVLQAMLLTQNEKMLMTPSYHVFDLYSVHQDATLVPLDVHSETYEYAGYSAPAVSVSASVDGQGKLHITLSNANPHKDIPLKVSLGGMKASHVHGRYLQGRAMNSHNTFDKPFEVIPQTFTGAKLTDGGLEILAPKMSVVALEVA
jgi:alpha-N-arabinofuranosidase